MHCNEQSTGIGHCRSKITMYMHMYQTDTQISYY